MTVRLTEDTVRRLERRVAEEILRGYRVSVSQLVEHILHYELLDVEPVEPRRAGPGLASTRRALVTRRRRHAATG